MKLVKQKSNKRISTAVLLFIFVMAVFGVFGGGESVLAADDRKPCNAKTEITLQIAIPGLSKVSNSTHDYCVPIEQGFPNYIKAIYNLFIGIVGILAVVMIMLGGFQWLLAAGNAQKIDGAKTTIISAIMGLVLALGSYTILNLINPEMVNLKLKVDPITPDNWKGQVFCFSTMEIEKNDKDEKEEDMPACGYLYKLYRDPSITCLGTKCINPIRMCFSSGNPGNESATCSKSLELDGNSHGFGVEEWSKPSIAAGGMFPEELKCGNLFYYQGTLGFFGGKDRFIGQNCPADKQCVIGRDKGYYFTTTLDEMKSWTGGAVGVVGEFKNRKCY